MEWDYEEDCRKEEERLEKRRAEISALCTDLERVLTHPSPETPALERQTDLLDCMLYTVMRHNLHTDKKNGYFNKDNLHLALRIQKQCMDTVKASSAASYMQSIVSASSGIYPAPPVLAPAFASIPATLSPPHENEEQTGETGKP